ncbi:helix-turn-helix domain-containing protein [Pseudomonas putida]
MKAAHPEVVAATRVNPGDTLRQARESKGWSLADVAVKLNLTATSLGNLEAGAFDKLPGHTFARGYIRAYAKLLGMDQAPLVQAFDQITGSHAQGSEVHALGRIEEPVRLSHNILRGVSLLLLVLIIGGGFFWWQDQTGQRGKDQAGLAMEHVEVESADGTTQIHPIDEPEDQAVTDAQKTEATQPAAAAETPATAPATATVQPAAPTVAATPAAPAQAPAVVHQPAAPVAPAVAAAPAAAPVPEAPAAGQGQLHVQFTADCWAQVTDGNGKVLVSGLKRKGDIIDLNGKPPFAVRLGYARGAQVAYNGQPVDVAPFTSGETARMKVGQ